MNSLQIDCIICQFPENLCDLTSQENEEIAKKLTNVTTIQIQANDSLPRYICYECIDTLNVVYDFLQQCREAKKRLEEELGWKAVKNHDGLEIRISFIKEEPLDMMEDEQLLYGTAPDNYATEEDLLEGGIDLGDDRKDIVFGEAKLAEQMIAESGYRKGSELQQHLKTHAEDRLQPRDRNFSCQSCQKSYTTKWSLKRHVKTTHMERKKAFVCYLCGKTFPQKATLEAHVYCCSRVSLTEPKKRKLSGCVLEEAKSAEPITAESGCRKGSELQENLKTHATDRLQPKDRNFSCQSCQKSYTVRESLKRHVKRTHMGKRPFICYLCGKAFPQKAALEAHVSLTERKRKSSGDAELKCTFCEKSNFRDICKLRIHLRTHTKEQPYECNECHKKFSRSDSLKRHQLIHSNEKPHKCDLCKMAFRQRCDLNMHKLSHTRTQSYECAVCKKAFRYRSDLNFHMRLHEDSTAQQRSVPKLVETGGRPGHQRGKRVRGIASSLRRSHRSCRQESRL